MPCNSGETIITWNAWKFKLWLCYIFLLWTFSFDLARGNLQEVFYVSEHEPRGTVVGVLSNAQTGFQVISPVPQDLEFSDSTGRIKTKTTLDRERQDKYDFLVLSFATSLPLKVIVYVNDVNDNSPTFSSSVYEFTPYEGTANEKTTLSATDPDKGSNSTQRYDIIFGNIGDVFELKTKQHAKGVYAELVVASGKALDRETRERYLLNVSAADGGSPPRFAYALVNVTVLDVDDNAPVFTAKEYYANVSESITRGTNVLNVSASDRDVGQNARIKYSIERGVHSDPDFIFGVNPDTGLIQNNQPLDYETKKNYKVFVVAQNPPSGQLATASVVIRVLDENDNDPTIRVTFEQPGSFQVLEDAIISTPVARIYTTDVDSGSNGEVDVTLEGGDGRFSARSDPQNSVDIIFVAKKLDRENQSAFHLKVLAKDRGQDPRTSVYNFIVNVGDVNDNSPFFDQAVYSAVVSENVTVNSTVVNTHAMDKDAGYNSELIYSIFDDPLNSKFRNWFKIDPSSGDIATATSLDREEISHGVLRVHVRDKGTPSRSANCTVLVNITDSNDNNPSFNQSSYQKSVVEGSTVGTTVIQVFAEDPDTGVNGRLQYFIEVEKSKYPNFPFHMDPNSGVITTSGTIDHEQKALYHFSVVARDGGGRTTSADMTVSVTDLNDNKPIFNPVVYRVEYFEDIQVGHVICNVTASDRDSGRFAQIFYDIVQGNDKGLFDINATSGVIYLDKNLDRETKDLHTLKIQATDGEGVQADNTATVIVTVKDVNDAAPVFEMSLYNFSTVENSQPPVVIGSVHASSDDLGVNALISYQIKAGNVEDAFVINSNGTIYLQKVIDHENVAKVVLVVEAKDGGQPPLYGYTNVSVTIIDLNDNSPSFESPEISVNVREDTKIGQSFYTMSANDTDSGAFGTVTYLLLTNPNDTFKLDTQSGALSIQHTRGFEWPNTYTVEVLAKDGGSPPRNSTVKLRLSVLDVNDHAPIFEKSSYTVNVSERTSASSNVLQVVASDQDTGSNARISYSFNPTAGSGDFGLRADGWVYTRSKLDRETLSIYNLLVVATDHGNPSKSSTVSVTVHVEDINDNDPQFEKSSYTFFVKERETNSTLVGTVSATDLDAGRNSRLSYKFELQSAEFVISSSTGEIRTNQVLDREKASSYDLKVVVSDAGVNPRTEKTMVTVIIKDVNDNSPKFVKSSYEKKVYEDIQVQSSIISVSAKDADEGINGLIRYSIVSSDKIFQIDAQSGVITLKSSLDREKADRHYLSIMAQDQGSPSHEDVVFVNIYVLDVNDNAPHFLNNSYFVNVPEKLAVGSEVIAVTANDVDEGDNGKVHYVIDSGNSGDTFRINATSGRIYLQLKLDYERRDNYKLKIVASDFGQHAKSSVISVTVYVLDANDNRPTFKENPIVASVRESEPINHTVALANADDADSDMNSLIHYSILSQSPGPPCFKIDPKSGEVKTTTALDHESVDQYTLIIQAEDQAFSKEDRLSSTATLLVIIEDVNDNKPRFVSPSVSYVMEDEPFGFPVLDILALDKDSKKNGQVEYRLVSAGIQREFSLDLRSGSLTLNNDLDHETKSKYVLNVSATDKGKPRLSSFQLLTIIVVDVNDNAPEFVNRSFVGSVAENMSPGSFVVQVSAVDLDSGSNGELTFSISSGTGRDKFIIDGSTGLITTNVSLDREQREYYSLTVTVMDNAFPFLVDTASVQVHVLDKNDHPPVFDPDVQSLHVAENKQHTDFHFLLAQDRDMGSNAEVEYTITMGNDDKIFQIGRSTGALSTVNPLNREQKSQYFLQVQAKNVEAPHYRATVNITIHVTDSNDNDPKFEKQAYQTTISELTKPYTKILTVRASDADIGTNGEVVYSLSSGAQGFFRIEPSSGDIYSLQSISYEQQKEFNFDCIAADRGVHVRMASASVKVLVKDENNHAPKFTDIPYRQRIAGNFAGTVFTVQAIDGDFDSFAKITYSMNTSLTSQAAASYFSLDGDKGEVTTKTNNRPDRRYILYIAATDGGSPPLSGHGILEILVGTVNDDPPKFLNSSSSFVSVLENSRDGTPVTQLMANKDQVTYSIIDGNPENPFNINHNTGLLTVANSLKLDYEKVRVFELFLVVTLSASSLNGYIKLYVNLTDENDNAPQLYPANVSVSIEEDNSTGNFAAKTIVNLTASDEDSGDNSQVTYAIDSGNDDKVFSIDASKGTLAQVKRVDHEKKDFYKLVVKATDNGKSPLSGISFVRVTIVDINDNRPIFYGASVVNVSENQQKGSEVASLSAKDADEDSNVVYAFQPGSSSQNVFSIAQFTGAITLQTALDYETIKQYSLDVSVSDGVYYTEKTLMVNVLDVNDNVPRFLNSSYKVTLSKDTPPGTSVIQVKAEDADSGVNGEVRYEFMTTANGFKVDRISGVISTTRKVRARDDFYTVRASDLGTPPQSNVVQVLIQIDGNPTFSKSRYDAKVPENAKRGTIIETVNATGESSDIKLGKINYKIISGDNFQNFRIGLRSGVIKVNRSLDYETTKSYLLVISAENGDSFAPATVTVNITVQDVNDNAPKFVEKQYSNELKEDVPIGTSVVTVSANDRDSGAAGRVRYSIQSGNDRGSFEINSTSGVLTTKAMLDHESIKRYQLSVEATDQGTPPRPQVVPVSIKVSDLNDNSPIFVIPNPEDVAVAENSPKETRVYTVIAEDRDSGSYGRVSYSITGGTGRGLFIINEQTGELTTNATFDYETQTLYSLELKAVDAGVPPLDGNLTVNVFIESVDEYEPQFQSKEYKFEVPGNAEVGTVIGQVSASDQDGGQDGVVYYSFHRPSTIDFAINRTSGEIYVNRTLGAAKARKRRNAEEVSIGERRVRRASDLERINLNVVARSAKANSLKDTVLVKVDVNLACPGCSTGKPTGTENYSSQALSLIVGLAVLAGVLVIGIIVALSVFIVRRKKRRHPQRTQRETFDGSFDEITVHQAPNGIANHVDSSLETLPPARRVSHPNDYSPVSGTIDPSTSGQRTDSSGTPNSASSSGRGSTEGDGEYGIVNDVGSVNSENNGKTTIPDSGIQQDADQVSQVTISDGESSILHGDGYSTERYDKILARLESQESLHVFGEEGGGEADGGVNPQHLLSAKLAEVDADEDESIVDGPQPYADEGRGQPSYGGSLSSIVGSQEELTGSYNWDHLLDWGPKFQPLADVFLEIGRMKDESPPKAAGMRLSIPSSRGGRPFEPSGIRTTDMLSSVSSLPRSPISPPSTQYTSPAFSPNFTPAITPLVTRSPSVSPLETGISTPARFSLHGSTPHLSRPSSMNVERLRRDSQTSELTHSPSISDNESNLEVDV